MVRTWFLVLAAVFMAQATMPVSSDAAPPQVRARWEFRKLNPGEVQRYRVEQLTSATEVIGGNKTTTTTKLTLVKRWQALENHDDTRATNRLVLSLECLRVETTKANGEVLLFDSSNPAKSTPELCKQLSRFVGKDLVELRRDCCGDVNVIKSDFGPASRFESEPPFVLHVPSSEAPKVGGTWQRAYHITLAPPQGTGEKFAAQQKYVCKAIKEGKATIALTTAIAKLPESPLDRVPLLQMQPEGEVIFDLEAGRLHSATLRIDKELKNHQGKESSYRFQSVYTEKYVGGK